MSWSLSSGLIPQPMFFLKPQTSWNTTPKSLLTKTLGFLQRLTQPLLHKSITFDLEISASSEPLLLFWGPVVALKPLLPRIISFLILFFLFFFLQAHRLTLPREHSRHSEVSNGAVLYFDRISCGWDSTSPSPNGGSAVTTRLVPVKMWVRSQALLSGLKIRCCGELWCRSQTQLRSVSVAVAEAGSCTSDCTPSPGTSICCRCSPKKKK